MSRDDFRNGVFNRDKWQCVICKSPAVDAHHIIERRLWPDGGYYLDNGASVCSECHLKAESTEISCDLLREKAGIKKVILPPHFYDDTRYDKWGNIICQDGSIQPGELFWDSNVMSIMRTRNPQVLVCTYTKYPRTMHLPWSEGITEDDRVLTHYAPNYPVVITEKMDGENTTLYNDHIHARSINSKSHESRDWVKNKWASIKDSIPPGMRICGENLFAKHAILYDNLPSYFMVFSIWEDNTCLSWDATVFWAELLDLHTVPVLYRGFLGDPVEDFVKRTVKINPEKQEGYVIRPEMHFKAQHFSSFVGKFVRKDHVTKSEHWLRSELVKNKLYE